MDSIFPTDVREFDSDDRISFSKLDNKFIAVHDDGTEYEFDADLKRWGLAAEEHDAPDLHEQLDDGAAYGAEDGESRKRKNGSGPGFEVSLPF